MKLSLFKASQTVTNADRVYIFEHHFVLFDIFLTKLIWPRFVQFLKTATWRYSKYNFICAKLKGTSFFGC